MISIAIGCWDCVSLAGCPSTNQSKITCQNQHGCPYEFYWSHSIHYQLYAPNSWLTRMIQCMACYLPQTCQTAIDILGQGHFSRVVVVLLPHSAVDMAFTSPELILIAPCLLAADLSMSVRMAHEVSHLWFGLLVTPRNWTEDWLSEGFATYMEDLLHAKVNKWSNSFTTEYNELQDVIRYKTLKSELQHTSTDLQCLRIHSDGSSVKNGLNPNKQYCQVHYLKGYFLLKYLSNQIGECEFLQFLTMFLNHFHGQMITSEVFLSFFSSYFKTIKNKVFDINNITHSWLLSAALPEEIVELNPQSTNKLYHEVQVEFKKFKQLNQSYQRKRSKRRHFEEFNVELLPIQLLLLLEELLEIDKINRPLLTALSHSYKLSDANVEIRHRWCELIIKHNHRSCYKEVEKFLREEQAMGIYLYGELMISNNKTLQCLAKQCYLDLKETMKIDRQTVLQQMLYGN